MYQQTGEQLAHAGSQYGMKMLLLSISIFQRTDYYQGVLKRRTRFLKNFTSNMKEMSKESEEEGVLMLELGGV